MSKINLNLRCEQLQLFLNLEILLYDLNLHKKSNLIKKTTSELKRISPSEYKQRIDNRIVVVLDNIRSKQNIGSIFRTCDAFGIGKIILCGISACPPDREIERTALGATLSVSWEYFANACTCISQLKESGYTIISVEQTHQGHLLNEFEFPDSKIALVFGNEVEGIDENVLRTSDICIEIPQRGTKHSLNVAVSAGIALWQMIQRDLKLLVDE